MTDEEYKKLTETGKYRAITALEAERDKWRRVAEKLESELADISKRLDQATRHLWAMVCDTWDMDTVIARAMKHAEKGR